ncbi:hypothetical protein M231_04603 [Tremella mesenterica]|uniref:Transcription factor spt8 beta-propeller domain-containing protein n=1 Tax=Tremella mesenterica TaxID=5217 RepID=A0A4Q1BKM1_TREME|nr:hypothetical protein M231_04603 [Tremella mesenterica]
MTSEDEDDEDEYDEDMFDEDGGVNGVGVNGEVNEEDGEDQDQDQDVSDGEEDDEEDDEEAEDDEEDEDDEDDEDEEEDDDDEDMEPLEEDREGDKDITMVEQPSDTALANQPNYNPQLPHLLRRALFVPPFSLHSPPSTLSIEAIVAIPIPSPVHSIATSLCSSWLLAGAQDGFVRAYDFYASVNGQQSMTSLLKANMGMGEGINKTGVGKGWWVNEVEGLGGMRAEPVYSMTCESDALWSLTGTKSGCINLYTLRHSPGHHVHTFKGHTNVVSCLSLLPDERSFISGSWDGTLREWDLNTGQTVRKYPSHGAQFSSISLRPYNSPSSPAPSQGDGIILDGTSISINQDLSHNMSQPVPVSDTVNPLVPSAIPDTDIEMDAPSPYDPLFDDDPTSPPLPPTSNLPNGHDTSTNSVIPTNPTEVNGIENGSLFVPLPTPISKGVGAAAQIPILTKERYNDMSDDILLTSSMDGQVTLIDRRVKDGGVGRLLAGEKAPPWCMSTCWAANGNQILAGRRNGTIDIWDIRRTSSTASNLLRTLRTPAESGPVSCVVPFPDGRHVAT